MTPACSSMQSILCPIACTAIVSTTTLAPCWWPARSTRRVNGACPKHCASASPPFVQHAWNGDRKRFRNFMSFDRRWLEDIGSEDSHGRSLWALGECARSDPNPSRRRWASALFLEALPAAESFVSPRAWSFTLLGLDAYLEGRQRESACIESASPAGRATWFRAWNRWRRRTGCGSRRASRTKTRECRRR